MDDQYLSILKEKFKLNAFRPGQLEAIQALLTHNRLLCIQPTGYGKSLLYQLPSCLLGGMTFVISPLLALMRDQIDQLTQRFSIRAASINSDQTEEENALVRKEILAGNIQILFASPEQLDHIDRFNFLLNLNITLFVIDEAHCISTWGHDFRPSYRLILNFSQKLKEAHPHLKILALTATADERVEKDISAQLSGIGEPVHVWRELMDRPNIYLSVLKISGIPAKLEMCHALLQEVSGFGLIYCATRENAELVAQYLEKQGVKIKAYHAGLESEEKRMIQQGFSHNAYRAIAATTALGMGIDKADLRFVIHFDIPGSITAYYQEVGRAGRDGLKAEGILLYDPEDRKIQEYFIDSALPIKQDFQAVLQGIRTAQEPLNLSKIKCLTGLHPTRVAIVLAELIEQQFLKKTSVKGSQVYLIDQESKEPDLSRYTVQHLVKTEELDRIIAYAEETTICRMTLLRKALGDHAVFLCGRCDLCQGGKKRSPLDAERAFKWLALRPVPIPSAKRSQISKGVSLFDSKLRLSAFLRFMKERAITEEIDPEILSLTLKQIALFPAPIGGIVPIPSKTWKAQQPFAIALAEHLQVPVLNLLSWRISPEKRQGELLNNDQRHYNVHEKMKVLLYEQIPGGALILLDDYIGSGATIAEAARALRKTLDQPLIPLTIAALKWKLGKPGFI